MFWFEGKTNKHQITLQHVPVIRASRHLKGQCHTLTASTCFRHIVEQAVGDHAELGPCSNLLIVGERLIQAMHKAAHARMQHRCVEATKEADNSADSR